MLLDLGRQALFCTAFLASQDHEVIMLEALRTLGEVLVYGIPEFRLPKEIVRSEVDYIQTLGVDVRLDSVVGRLQQVDELFKEQVLLFS